MQTNDNTHENKNSKRTFIVIGLAVAVAGALVAAFVLGGRTGGSEESSADRRAAVSPTAAAEGGVEGSTTNPDGQSNPPQSSDDQGQSDGGGNDLPDPTQTPARADEGEEETPTDTPTATSTPTGECAFCPDGLDLVAETPTGPDPCPECVFDLDIALPIDVTPPIIENIETTFCFPVFQVEVELDAPAEVWFEYHYMGGEYESAHMDAANTVNIGEDLGGFGWGVYLINPFYVHAVDLSGNHAVSGPQTVPDPDLSCD